MALIVFHTGMPKTGSTNVQRWLAEQSDSLRDHDIACVRITPGSGTDTVTLVPVTPQSGAMSAFLARDMETRAAVTSQICDTLDAYATRAGTLVVSSESYEVLFNSFGRREVLPRLDALAGAHSVRVAYYVRPQHSWLESAWLQWGFRHNAPPDDWIRWQRARVNYLETLHVVREIAPRGPFEMRPFRADVLDGGDVVRDFAHVFLGIDGASGGRSGDRSSNRSLPLEAALLLRGAPPGLFWSSIHDNKMFYPLKELLGWNLPETDRAKHAREVLHRYAYATFEIDNEQLIRELNWPTEYFIPRPGSTDRDPEGGLSQLNDLWSTTASDAERLVFYRALELLLAELRPSPRRHRPSESHRDPAPPATRRVVRRVRAIAGRARDRIGPQSGLTVASSKQTRDGELLRLRFRNSGRGGTFAATAVMASDATRTFRLAWRGAEPRASVWGRAGATEVLRFALALGSGGFNVLELEEPADTEQRYLVPDSAEVTVVIRRCQTNETVAEMRFWMSSEMRDGTRAATISSTAPSTPTATESRRPRLPPSVPRRRDDGDSRIADVAGDVGLDLTTRTFGAVVFDYDNDGWPDIFLGRHDASALLFKNDNGRFVHVDSVRFPERTDRHCAAAGDLTGDGRADLFCVVGGDSGHGPKGTANELWLQQSDGSFANVGEQAGLADPYGRGREPLLFDATGNGRLDILVGNVSPRSDGKPSPNRLFLNEGGGVFRPAPELGLDLEYSVGGAGAPGSRHGGGNWPMGRLVAFDADGNGWTDVLMVAKAPGDSFQSVHLFQNDEGRGFHDVSADAGVAAVPGRDVAIADMDGDGQPDLVVVDGRGLFIYVNDGGKFRLDYKLPIDHAFRVAVADADGDGRNDIYVMRTSGVPGPDIPDLLLLRTGARLDFEAVTLPTVEGTVRDDAVYPIDYDQDGRYEFLVLHGHSLHAAPIQLISLR